eukprot:TRINITY_DN8054_c0_g1_i3.p1 TRINITY_DN8054_c0_g1~~TRINITY_DN8054_c0_g1_i3.p1  ORF type:complete len:207 (+),score=50.18 TRINITY_DN8054_c0_g1_i3:61-681(+)
MSSSGVVTVAIKSSPAQRAGLKVGMRIVAVNDMPVAGENVLDALRKVGDSFTVQTTKGSGGGGSPLSMDTAWKSCVVAGVLQHLVSILLYATRCKQYTILLSIHAILYEIAGTAILLCSNVSTFNTILLRIVMASPWALPALGLITEVNAELLAPWVIPTAAAVCLYLSVAHLLPVLVQSTKYGIFGLLIQLIFLAAGVFVHTVVG